MSTRPDIEHFARVIEAHLNGWAIRASLKTNPEDNHGIISDHHCFNFESQSYDVLDFKRGPATQDAKPYWVSETQRYRGAWFTRTADSAVIQATGFDPSDGALLLGQKWVSPVNLLEGWTHEGGRAAGRES